LLASQNRATDSKSQPKLKPNKSETIIQVFLAMQKSKKRCTMDSSSAQKMQVTDITPDSSARLVAAIVGVETLLAPDCSGVEGAAGEGVTRLRLPDPAPTFLHRFLQDFNIGLLPFPFLLDVTREADLHRLLVNSIKSAHRKAIGQSKLSLLNQIFPHPELAGFGGVCGGGRRKPRL
jgi:hypothetical protein